MIKLNWNDLYHMAKSYERDYDERKKRLDGLLDSEKHAYRKAQEVIELIDQKKSSVEAIVTL